MKITLLSTYSKEYHKQIIEGHFEMAFTIVLNFWVA